MKKIFCLLFIIIISLIVGLFVYSSKKDTIEEFYTILESKGYVVEEDREISFDIYSRKENTLISNPSNNEYTLELDKMKLRLENVHIDLFQIKEKLYLIKVYASMPLFEETEYKSMKQDLIITNSKYSIRLSYGEISFLNPKGYELLSLDSLYGSYIKYNESMLLAGINLTFHDSYEYLTNLRVGPASGILSKARDNLTLDTIIDIPSMGYSYKPNKQEDNYLLSLKSNIYFIPLGYKTISIIRSSYITLELDLKKYYFDSFDFMTNTLDIEEYKDFEKKGEIIYA